VTKERAKILDDFDHCVINRTIHGLYSWKIAPTVSIIHKKIKDSIKISKSKLTLQYAVIFAIKWLETVLLKLNGLKSQKSDYNLEVSFSKSWFWTGRKI
jgi:hypothetical protein